MALVDGLSLIVERVMYRFVISSRCWVLGARLIASVGRAAWLVNIAQPAVALFPVSRYILPVVVIVIVHSRYTSMLLVE